jgi:mono/diheme cytochrome c family protein
MGFLPEKNGMYKYAFLMILMALVLGWACGAGDEKNTKKAARDRSGDAALTPDGMAVFRKNCVTCHGSDGTLGLNGAKDLTKSTLSLEDRVNLITNGKKLMTPFKALLSPEEIQAVAMYTQSLYKP